MDFAYLKKVIVGLSLVFLLLQGCAVWVRGDGYDHGHYYHHGYWR